MKNSFDALVENSKNAIKYWWLMLIIGLGMLFIGFMVFAYPVASYVSMTMMFGWLILLSGIAQIMLYITNKHVITSRGWMLAGGIIETVLGLVLIFSLSLSASTLPIFLGFWLLFKSFNMVGLGSDMGSFSVPGSGWIIFTGFLLMLASIYILIQPLVFGVEVVIIWVGVSLIIGGVSLSIFSLQLRNAHKHFAHY